MDERRSSLLSSAPDSFIFEECFKKNGTHVTRAKVVLNNMEDVDPSDMMKCSPLLTREQEYRLFRKYNYYRYRILSTIAGPNWPKVVGNRDEIERKILRMDTHRIKKAEGFVILAEEIRNTILKSNMRLMLRPVSKYENQESQRKDELISNSCLHIIRAINGFDYRRGIKFSTYCVNTIQNNLYRDYTNETTRISRAWGEMDEKKEVVFHENKSTSGYDSRFVSMALDSLNPRQKAIVSGFFGINEEKKRLRDIASKMGIKRYAVVRMRDEALKKMSGLPYDPLV